MFYFFLSMLIKIIELLEMILALPKFVMHVLYKMLEKLPCKGGIYIYTHTQI